MRQLGFGFLKDYKKEFGGSLLTGKRKTKRPLSTKHPLHLILKSCEKGIFNPSNKSLEKLIKSQAQKFNIKIYDLALNWSHIHMAIRIKSREHYIGFIKSLTSILAQKVRHSRPQLKEIFHLRPFTRILTWGRDFKTVLNYQTLNQLEALGLVNRKKKKANNSKIQSSSLHM